MNTIHKSLNKNATRTARKASQPPLHKQPASKTQAAVQHGIFLSTSDKWSLAYFNPDDLHCQERELFG